MNSPKPNEKNISRSHSNKSSKSSNNNDFSDGEELTPVSKIQHSHLFLNSQIKRSNYENIFIVKPR